MSGNDLALEDNFKWSSNGRPFTYANWNIKNPSNSNGSENCVEVLGDIEFNGQWNDNNCSEQFYFICESVSPKTDQDKCELFEF